MAKFEKGKSGNPKGMAPGTKHTKTKLANELAQLYLLPHAKDIIDTCVNLAKSGDMDAIKVCMERLIPRASIDFSQFMDELAQFKQMVLNSTESKPISQDDDDEKA